MTWLLLRTTGFLVLGLLTVAVSLGIAGPAIRDPRVRLVSVTVHRAAAVLGTLLLLAHVTFAVLDTWVTVSPLAVFLPGASAWEPLWIGLGALAFDTVLLLAVTSALRRRFANLWWNVHLLSYVAFALAWLHALGVGTDASDPVMLWLAGLSAAAVAASLLLRISRPGATTGVGLPARRESTEPRAGAEMISIPGIAVGQYPAAPRPMRLLRPGSLLLAGPPGLAGHRAHWGPVPRLDVEVLANAVGQIVGAGGAEFPSPRKLRSLAGRNVAAVVINAMEGEPASAKDGMLLWRAPHLVLDGAVTAAQALGTRNVVVRMADGRLANVLRAALAERTDANFSISCGPDSFVAGEASAIARALRGGPSRPDGNSRPPTIGWTRRPIFLSNVETFARIAVASRGDQPQAARC